jgi:F0F1-type ATP synthase membrane subunit b/b'
MHRKKSLEIIKRREEQARQKISTYETEAINDIKKISTTVAIQSARTFIQTNLDKKQNISLIKNASNEIKSKLIN